jgi:hypothetical protein
MILALRTRFTKATNAKAPIRPALKRGAQQRLAEAEPQRNFIIFDALGHVVS